MVCEIKAGCQLGGITCRKEYDAERLVAVFPGLAGCVKSAVNTDQLEACVTAGMVTETELELSGVLTRSLHSRALIVKPLGGRRP